MSVLLEVSVFIVDDARGTLHRHAASLITLPLQLNIPLDRCIVIQLLYYNRTTIPNLMRFLQKYPKLSLKEKSHKATDANGNCCLSTINVSILNAYGCLRKNYVLLMHTTHPSFC